MKHISWKIWGCLAGLGMAWLFLGWLIYRFAYGPSGLNANRALESRITAIENDLKHLEGENDALRREIQYRRSEHYLEELARTEFRRIYPGETMIIFLTPTPGQTPTDFPGTPD
jgi:cell division protein FtsB